MRTFKVKTPSSITALLLLAFVNKGQALVALAFAVSILANPLLRVRLPSFVSLPRSNVAQRQCAETCGSTCYSQDDIDAAVEQGYGYYEDGTTVGNDKYPHKYNDYEGFTFPDDGPYYEFPILSDEDVYTGGSPGADRVIFTGSGTYEGVITHTGASGNDFLQCIAD